MNMNIGTLFFVSFALVACNGTALQVNTQKTTPKGLILAGLSQVAGGDTTVAVNSIALADIKENQEFTLPIQKQGQ